MVPVMRSLIGVLGLLCLLQYAPLEPRLLAPAALLALLLMSLGLMSVHSRARHDRGVSEKFLMVGIAGSIAGLVAVRATMVPADLPLILAGPVALAVAAVVAIASSGRRAAGAFCAVLVVYVLMVIGDLWLVDVRIDVKLLLSLIHI